MATHDSNTTLRFAVNNTIISEGDESAYRAEGRALTSWCQDNKLLLNVSKIKELIVDYRRLQGEDTPHSYQGERGGECQLLQIPGDQHQ